MSFSDIIPFNNWQDFFQSPHSGFFSGSTQDTVADQRTTGPLSPFCEAMFTQSNGRVLVGQSANGDLRLIAIPTRVYPAPTTQSEFNLGPGMYYRSDVVMYVGDLHYKIRLDGVDQEFDLTSAECQNRTWYADHFIPLTSWEHPNLEMHTFSLAPLAYESGRAALAPAPLPGPAGAIYVLHLRNFGQKVIRGKIGLEMSDRLIGHYEDADPQNRDLNRPDVSLRQNTLILTRPFGAVGIHLHEGKWVQTNSPFCSERMFSLQPGEEILIETFLSIGASYHDILSVIYELYLHTSFQWLNRSAAYWRSRLGQLVSDSVGASEEARLMQEIYIRSLFDNFNCLQTDVDGNLLIHWQGAPSHGYGVCWGIDVEPTAVSLVHFCPEIVRQVMLFFMNRSRAPIGAPEHSLPILVAPVIIARQWLQVSSDVAFLQAHPEVLAALQSIIDELIHLKPSKEDLFPSRYSSDGPVGRRYDFGANVKVLYAFDSLAYLFRNVGRVAEAEIYQKYVDKIRAAVQSRMVVEGPFGKQISGGTNLGEDPAGFYLPEKNLYYDGEDTSSMLAPIYGACDLDWLPWINYHRFARSLWCPTYDPEFGMLNWFPSEPAVQDGTSFFSRLGGSVAMEEMQEAVDILRTSGVDDITGSVFWWPHGSEYKRSLTRCSQGQGAWVWQYFQQWLGIKLELPTYTLTLAPRGLLTSYTWKGFSSGENVFDLEWVETKTISTMRIVNHNSHTWHIRVGFRTPGNGATDQLTWKEADLLPDEELFLQCEYPLNVAFNQQILSMTENDIRRFETQELSPDSDLLFKRYGPAMLWGNWVRSKWWQPEELPNCLRFILFNNSFEDWLDTTVTLVCPVGWTAQARLPHSWAKPENMQPDEITLNLGILRRGCFTVAPFWIGAPGGKGLLSPIASGFFGAIGVSSHTPSQPGDGLQLVSPSIQIRQEIHFTAELVAHTSGGEEIRATREVSVILESTKSFL